MIVLKNIYKSFGGQRVLEDLSLEIPDGGRVAVMGRSGAGKTTLINIIMGLVKPDGGEVSVPKGTGFGAVFQEDRLIEGLSAAANCRLVVKDKSADVNGALSALGITEDLAEKPVFELSGGERRRVAVARAALSSPDVMVLDEPFKGIDSGTLPSVERVVNKASDRKTFILVTHSEEEAYALGCKIFRI